MRDRHRPITAPGMLSPIASGFVVGLAAALVCFMTGGGVLAALGVYALAGAAGLIASALAVAFAPPVVVPSARRAGVAPEAAL